MYLLKIMGLLFFFQLFHAKNSNDLPESDSSKKLASYLATKPEFTITKQKMVAFRSAKTPAVGIALHRAANEFAPENTLPAMEIALQLEVDYIELDVRLTKDGKSLILHDGSLNRTTNGKGPLREKSFEEARALTAGKWFDPFFNHTQIPTLDESCQLLFHHNKSSKHPTYFYVDCKDIDAAYLIETLKKYRLLDESVFYVNDIQQIALIRQFAPKAKILPGLGNESQLEKLIEAVHPYALDVNWKDLSKDLIDKAHAHGVKIFSDGFGEVMNVSAYSKAIQEGIDVISTNKTSVICDAAASLLTH